jgi:heptosyltransferase-2
MQKKIDKVLVVRLSSLGDIILTTPVLEILKENFPQSRIYFLTKTQYRDLLASDPRLSGLIEFDPKGKHKGFIGFKRLIDELRLHNFDLLVDLHANPRSFLIHHFTRSGIKIKYNKRWFSRWMMVHMKFLKTKPIHILDSYLGSLKRIQLEIGNKNPTLFLSQDDLEFSEKFLLEEKVKKDDIVIGVNPGAKWETKRWDEEKFMQACQNLIEKLDCKIMLSGDSGDEELIPRISRNLPDSRLIKAMGLSLGKFMSLIRRCDCLITNDSGPMHIAQALNVPVVAIFGPTHPKLGFAPSGSKNVVLCADVKCCPCSLHGERKCHKKTRLCMDLITPEMVAEAVADLLKGIKPIKKET